MIQATETATQTQSLLESGERPPLLFVHGAWHGAWCWEDHFVPWFSEKGWTCHTVNLRHHGGRGGPKSLRRSRIRDYVDDVAAAVADLSSPPIIVAHSMGGLVAQRYLEEKRLSGAVLLASVPIGGVWRATGRSIRRHPLKFLQANLVLDLKPLVDSPRMVRSMLLDPDADDALVTSIAARVQGESWLAYADMMWITRARPQLVHTPVAVIAGQHDRIFSVKEQRRLARAYGVEATVIPGAAHNLMVGKRWEQTATAVEAALHSF